jgi:hypothetical protein
MATTVSRPIFLRQLNGLVEIVAMLFASFRVRIHRITVAVQCADDQSSAFDGSHELGPSPRIAQQFVRVTVGGFGETTGGDFHRLNSLLHHPIEGSSQRQIGKPVGK